MKRLAIILLILGLLAAVPAAHAAPSSAIKNLNETPGEMATDTQRNAWVVIGGVNDTVARVKPSGDIKKYEIPELDNAGGVALGHDDHMWFTVTNKGVVELNPSDPKNVHEYDIDAIGDARGITRGPAGRMYAASDDQLVSFKPSDPENFKHEAVAGMAARGIAAAKTQIFVADFAGGRIIKASQQLEVLKKFDVGGNPQQVTTGPDGSVAYGNPGTDPQTVGRISANGKPKTTDLPAMTDPFGMAFMPDGKFWFTEFARNRMGTLTTGGNVHHVGGLIPNNSGPRYSGEGKNGVLFVGLELADKIAILKGIN